MQKSARNNNTGALPAHVRKVNIKRILRLMFKEQRFAKIDLTRISGISTTTMTKLFSQLEMAGLIEKDVVDRESFGRPRTFFRLATKKICLVAAVVDIDEVEIAAFSLNGEKVTTTVESISTGKERRNFYSRFAKCVDKVVKRDGRTCIQLVISMPGLIEQDTGEIAFCPNLHWLEKSNAVKELEKKLKNIPVMVVHEEKALCFAQQKAEESNNFVLIDFSSGVGAGVFSNGELLTGSSGFAGEIGHITVEPDGALCGCGNRGCLETVASDKAYYALKKKTGAKRAVEKVLKYQAIGIAAVINLFNPSVVCVHSVLKEALPDYLEQLSSLVSNRALVPSFSACRIITSGAGKLKGAALCGIDRVFKSRFE